jgi:hypothetical protein
MTDDEVRDSMYEGIRLAQDLCYCRDWDLFLPMEYKQDPFGRKPERVLNNLAAAVPQFDEDNHIEELEMIEDFVNF